MSNQKNNGSIIAIITMMFLYAMIGFVTNLTRRPPCWESS